MNILPSWNSMAHCFRETILELIWISALSSRPEMFFCDLWCNPVVRTSNSTYQWWTSSAGSWQCGFLAHFLRAGGKIRLCWTDFRPWLTYSVHMNKVAFTLLAGAARRWKMPLDGATSQTSHDRWEKFKINFKIRFPFCFDKWRCLLDAYMTSSTIFRSANFIFFWFSSIAQPA